MGRRAGEGASSHGGVCPAPASPALLGSDKPLTQFGCADRTSKCLCWTATACCGVAARQSATPPRCGAALPPLLCVHIAPPGSCLEQLGLNYPHVSMPSHPPCHRQALHKLREQGKRLLFVTNNSSKSRSQYVAKFAGLGIEVEAQEVRGREGGSAEGSSRDGGGFAARSTRQLRTLQWGRGRLLGLPLQLPA